MKSKIKKVESGPVLILEGKRLGHVVLVSVTLTKEPLDKTIIKSK